VCFYGYCESRVPAGSWDQTPYLAFFLRTCADSFFLSFLHAVGIYFFTKGFLLTRLVLEDKSSCDVLPFDDRSSTKGLNVGNSEKGCWHPKTFDKAVFIIIDALRYDFTVPFHPRSEGDQPHIFHNNIPVLYETAVQSPEKAFLLPFIADPPTTTLQRLKGLTTGTLPTFIDAGSNFAGTAIDEDNTVAQLLAAGKNLVHLGDDTWHALFPNYFDPNLTHPFDSFNVWDLHTVDNGVNKYLFPLLHPDNATKWDVIFGHYLGVDHAGHRYGPDHAAAAAKLRQMDQVIRDIIERVDDKTLLIVMGDHGMDSKGDHGGESDDEVEAALWMYSKKGVFGRTNSDFATPPKTAKERPIPQIDIVPTLSLLLGIPIPFNNLGSPIEEAFVGRSGSDLMNLATVNRLTSAQIKRYQHHYATARGVDHSNTSGPLSLWSQAEKEWNALTKSSLTSAEKFRSAYKAYREYQRDTLSVCRGLWARFDVPSMIEGVAMLFGGLVVLIFYARGLRVDRTHLTPLILPRIGLGLGLGAGAGFLSVFITLEEVAILDRLALGAAAGSMLGAASAVFWVPNSFKSPLPNSLWSWFAVIITVSQSVGFASNSYTIWEDQILLFFLTSFGVLAGISSMRQRTTSDRVLGVYHSILFVLLGRLASFSRLCREEQMPFCRSTYYASATSSTSAPWQLIIPFSISLILPAVVRSFYEGSKSYEGSATLWIGVAFRIGLLVSAIFWTLDTADDGEWFTVGKTALKSVKVLLAQLVLAVALAAGTTTFVWAKPCVSINVSASDNDQPGQQPGRTTVTILGFANVHGTRFFLLVINFCLAITIVSKPMGQGAIALELWQILSLLEILDTNALSTTNSAIGPVMLGLLGSFHFFKTGHQATLSSIQWESAFVALSTIRYPWSPLLVVLNTFGAQILAAVAVPLVVLWKRPINADGRIPITSPNKGKGEAADQRGASSALRLTSDVAQAAATHMLYYATINLATTMWAGHLRRHLMLYRIFSPRFMMGATVLGVVDLMVAVVAVGLGLRWNTVSVAEIFGW
jgi:phosphatidylinositol glycan class O